MKKTKAQGISLNVVVIAAIALLVLVILSVILIQRGGSFQRGLSCEAQPNTQCMEACGGDYSLLQVQYECPVSSSGVELKCCQSLGE